MVFIHRLTAWLCLALALFAGLTPAQGFVVCIEQDGCVSIEVKEIDGDCDSCEDHDADSSELAVEEVACPCVDLEVPGTPDELVTQPRAVELCTGVWLSPAPSHHVRILDVIDAPANERLSYPPRPAQALTHTRTVVLRI